MIYTVAQAILVILAALAFAAHLVSIGSPYVREINGRWAVLKIGFLGRNRIVAVYGNKDDAYCHLGRILAEE